MLVQRSNRVERPGIRWLIAGKFFLSLRHDIGQHLVEPLDAILGDVRLHSGSDGRVHDDRLICIAVHSRLGENDRLVLDTVGAGDSPSEPPQVSRYQGAVNVPNDQTCERPAHIEHSDTRVCLATYDTVSYSGYRRVQLWCWTRALA